MLPNVTQSFTLHRPDLQSCRQSRISCTPYPPFGWGTLSQGAQNSVPSPLRPQRKLRSPNWNMKH